MVLVEHVSVIGMNGRSRKGDKENLHTGQQIHIHRNKLRNGR